ncbi:hypothetical protein ASF43_10285 [Pseudorhodoferax sp. Leaf267]|nr:hypothetical protein ASF43_10285 [Pseudorhodoferax sp. Leaf267]
MQQHPRQPLLRTVGLVSALALTLGLAACNRQTDTTVGQKMDSAMAKTEQAAADTKQAAGNMVDKVEAKLDDAGITAAVNTELAKDPDLSAMKINVDTKSSVVTLTGPAPSADAKNRATTIAQGVKGVAGVNNNLEVRAS